MILGLSGRKGAGKDTVAAGLGYYRVAFADALKTVCFTLFGVPADPPDKEGPSRVRALHEDRYLSHREVWQQIGMLMRTFDPDCWVRAAMAEAVRAAGPVAVTDVRMPNEVEAIRAAGGRVVRLTRSPAGDADTHASETALDGYAGFDAVVDNARQTPEQTVAAVRELIRGWSR